MPPALFVALIFTVALLVTTAYFLLGSVPLLVLSHDTPMDARFVRGFFNTYYLAALASAGLTALSLVVAGRYALAAVAAALAVLALGLRHRIIPSMDALQARIPSESDAAIRSFRRLHLAAVAVTLAQLVVIVATLIAASRP